ncbi:MAG TPA: sigma-54 dependent transcriptional regulator [Methylophilaceae bacterium]|jgi:sigma-54-specific transcriptional regulator
MSQIKPWIYEAESRLPPDQGLTYPNPSALSLSVRASALVFSDPKSQQLRSLIERVAPSDATALIIGETGTGKELVARHLHNLSPRSSGPFAAVNCGAFSEALVESELFGHEKGAFTGAIGTKEGWFESADGGTLFLDEIGDLPLSTQVKLLRVLQEREIVRIGSRKPIKINVRLIAATNVDLEGAVKAGRFREDLYYRIKVIPIQLPPLRDRPGDILPLIEYFLRVYKNKLHAESPELTSAAISALLNYPWPGNIRELENTIHRALLVANGDAIHAKDLHLAYIPSATEPTKNHENIETAQTNVNHNRYDTNTKLVNILNEMFEQGVPDLFEYVNSLTVSKAYDYANNNQVHTAKLLGISRNVLRARLKDLKLID